MKNIYCIDSEHPAGHAPAASHIYFDGDWAVALCEECFDLHLADDPMALTLEVAVEQKSAFRLEVGDVVVVPAEVYHSGQHPSDLVEPDLQIVHSYVFNGSRGLAVVGPLWETLFLDASETVTVVASKALLGV